MARERLHAEIEDMLRVQEMRGERLVNHIRFVFVILSFGMLLTAT